MKTIRNLYPQAILIDFQFLFMYMFLEQVIQVGLQSFLLKAIIMLLFNGFVGPYFVVAFKSIIIIIFAYKFIMQNTKYSSGPKFFGTTAKKSWFDEGDRCAPGPGAHELYRMNKTNPPVWTSGKDDERDAFLDKYPRPYPSPDKYKAVGLDKTHYSQPKYSIPVFENLENVNKIDEGNSLEYKPKYNVPKERYPDYSFGYIFERDYTSGVPPPNTYDPKRLGKKDFNKTQRSFSIGARPNPYGQEGKYPHVGKYNVGGNIGGTKYSIGNSERPQICLGASPGQFYNIVEKNKSYSKCQTIGLLITVPLNKDLVQSPPPNQYNAHLPDNTKNIITYRSLRSQIANLPITKYPNPQQYVTVPEPKEQTVSFTMEKRYEHKADENPGVGSYQVEKPFNKTLGHMAIKLKKMTDFVNPSPSAYQPKEDLTKPLPQRAINYRSDRTDFSKSITGRSVGPGVYEVRTKEELSLGKIGTSPKFPANKNKNPGPGYYEIPNGIGKLPKYCTGPKKTTTAGFSCIELSRLQRMKATQTRQEAVVKLDKQNQEQSEKNKEQASNELLNNSSAYVD